MAGKIEQAVETFAVDPEKGGRLPRGNPCARARARGAPRRR